MIDSILSLFRNPGIVVGTRRVGKKNQSSVGFKAHSQPELAHKVSFVMTNEYAYFFPHMLTQDRRPPPKPEINKHDKRIRNKTKQEFCSFLRLTVRFLVTSTSTWTTELLGLGPSGIGDEKCAVVLEESLLELVLGVLVNELLVVGDDGLGDGLADGVDLGDVTTTGDADTDIDTGELVEADDQKGLVDLIPLDPVHSDSHHPIYRFHAIRTLKRSCSGLTRLRGWPLTLMRPLPCCKKAVLVCVSQIQFQRFLSIFLFAFPSKSIVARGMFNSYLGVGDCGSYNATKKNRVSYHS